MKNKSMYTVEVLDKNILINAKWSDRFHYLIKSHSGAWSGMRKGWLIHKEYINCVDCWLYQVYGDNVSNTVTCKISNYSINQNLILFGRKLIELNRCDNTYTLDSSIDIMKGNFPINWACLPTQDFNSGYIKNYFFQKVDTLINPFRLINMTIEIDNVSTKDIQDLKKQNLDWISEIKVVA